jgi:hypothetical protein
MLWQLLCEYLTDSYHSSARRTPVFLKDAPHQVPAITTRVPSRTATVLSCVPHQIWISVSVMSQPVRTWHVFYVWRVSRFVITSRNVTYTTSYVTQYVFQFVFHWARFLFFNTIHSFSSKLFMLFSTGKEIHISDAYSNLLSLASLKGTISTMSQ